MESQELKNKIKQLQDLIDKLNCEIFKYPQNCTRPPSEYLEIYNSFTENLHNLQVRKQMIDSQNDILKKNMENMADNTMTEPEEDSSVSPVPNSPISSKCDELELFDPLSNQKNNISNSSSNNSINREVFDSKKPPLPKNANVVPRLKLEHPTYLQTSSSNSAVIKYSTSASVTPTHPNKPGNYFMSSSASHSPATTPVLNPSSYSNETSLGKHIYNLNNNKANLDLQLTSNSPPKQQNYSSNLHTSTSSSSLPLVNYIHQQINSANNNSAIAHNSRSFTDINDAVITPIIGPFIPTATTPTGSLSPPSSAATTPTSFILQSSFLRVYIGNSTAVVRLITSNLIVK